MITGMDFNDASHWVLGSVKSPENLTLKLTLF